MNKLLLVLSFLCFLTFLCHNGECPRKKVFGTGWSTYDLKANPKKVTQIEFKAGVENGIWKSKEVYGRNEVDFEESGKINQNLSFNADGELQNTKLYKYSQKGILDSIISIVDKDTLLIAFYDYSNCKYGYRLRKEALTPDWYRREKWKRGKLVSEEFIKGEVLTSINYKYDENGIRILEKYWRKENSNTPPILFECSFEIIEFDKNKNWVWGRYECNDEKETPSSFFVKRIIEY